MKISYAIPVCNEFVEIQQLITFLLENKRDEDEIVVLYDSNNGDKEVETYLRKMNVEKTLFRWASYAFEGNFAAMKNRLNSLCSGDYIFQIDADEMVTEYMVRLLPQILATNTETDLIRVPRVNKVKGLTEAHVQKWGWVVDGKGRVNWPDMQWRIYRNDPRIRWHGEVHEKIMGHATHSILPMEEDFALIHNKTIERQEKQNDYYDKL
jgi:hypothetical protein